MNDFITKKQIFEISCFQDITTTENRKLEWVDEEQIETAGTEMADKHDDDEAEEDDDDDDNDDDDER